MLKKELIGFLICTLLITVAVAPGINALTINQLRVDSQQSVTVTNGKLIDGVEIECRGIYLVDILLAIFWLPVFYIEINLHNLNEVPISVNTHIVLATHDGRVLYDFWHELPFKLPADPYHVLSTSYFTRRAWKEKDYMWGRFNLTQTLYIPDDGSSKTLVFHGFMFNIGSVIFNPEGEIIE